MEYCPNSTLTGHFKVSMQIVLWTEDVSLFRFLNVLAFWKPFEIIKIEMSDLTAFWTLIAESSSDSEVWVDR